jgi:ferritin-like metal-binding protein YciE
MRGAGGSHWRHRICNWEVAAAAASAAGACLADLPPPKRSKTPHAGGVHPMKLNSLNDLLIKELRDLYSAEKQLIRALPKMAKAANSAALQEAIEEHLEVTKEQAQRLEDIFEMLSASSRGPKCAAMEGLIEEGEELLEQDAEAHVRDAGLIGAAQRVEHYEIAGYGVARTFARLLGHDKVADLLQTTLDEEAATDKKLTELAESEINVEAASAVKE